MSIRIVPHLANVPEVGAIAEILQRQVRERCGVLLPIEYSSSSEALVELAITSDIGREGFRIEDSPSGGVRIVGHDPCGLLYGVGKFLRTSRYEENIFSSGTWRGTSVPTGLLRGMYLATHFHNYYHDAPVEEIARYVEEIALWGLNTLCVWFDRHHYTGFDDPQAVLMRERLRVILRAAKRIGLKVTLMALGNEAYANSPIEMRAEWRAQNGYRHEPCGHYHIELCPNKPGAMEQILRWHEEVFAAFAGDGIDYLCLWPYDQGGCTCSKCAPWGCNGFLSVAEKTADLFHHHFPNGKVILSTWYFDRFTSGEWQGLVEAWSPPPGWVDFLLAEQGGEKLPEFPLRHGVPGNLPLINFPEISMWGTGGYGPWGGFGASPLPGRLQDAWAHQRSLVVGGFPYSEGIYEDMSKAVCAQHYWDRDSHAIDTVREYIAYEFGPEVVDPVVRAVGILEKNLVRWREDRDGVVRYVMAQTDGARDAFQLLAQIENQISRYARTSWRWRILYLRALIDAELTRHDFALTEACEKAMEELTRIYHAENAAAVVAPPTRKALQANRGM